MSDVKMTGLNFNAAEVKPDVSFEPIPAGWYNAIVTGGEVKPTKDGSGLRANIQFKVLDGQFANRVVFNGYNVKNASPKAEEIGRAQFSALLHAVGVLNMTDVQQIYNIPLKIRVKIQPAQNGYEAKNEVSACKNINDVEGGVAGGSGPALGGGPALGAMPTMMPTAAPVAAAAAPAAMPLAGGFVAPSAPQPWAQPAAAAPVAAATPAAAPAAAVGPVATAPAAAAPVAAQAAPVAQPAPAAQAQPAWAGGAPTQAAPAAAPAAEAVAQPLPTEAAAAQAAVPSWAIAPAAAAA